MTRDIKQALWKIVSLCDSMGYKRLWNSRKKNIPVQNAALFLFMIGNAAKCQEKMNDEMSIL